MKEQPMVTLKAQLFGALRDYDDGDELTLHVPCGADEAALRAALLEVLRKKHPAFSAVALIAETVVALDGEILPPGRGVVTEGVVAFLPPVCGG